VHRPLIPDYQHVHGSGEFVGGWPRYGHEKEGGGSGGSEQGGRQETRSRRDRTAWPIIAFATNFDLLTPAEAKTHPQHESALAKRFGSLSSKVEKGRRGATSGAR